jgi:hypothetical protein
MVERTENNRFMTAWQKLPAFQQTLELLSLNDSPRCLTLWGRLLKHRQVSPPENTTNSGSGDEVAGPRVTTKKRVSGCQIQDLGFGRTARPDASRILE